MSVIERAARAIAADAGLGVPWERVSAEGQRVYLDMAKAALSVVPADTLGAVERIEALRRTQHPDDPDAGTARDIRVWNEALDAARATFGGSRAVRDPDEKMLSVADFDRLIRERDDYKQRWETLGRVSKRMIEKRDEQLRGAVERAEQAERLVALYRENAGPDLTRLVEYEAKLAAERGQS